ncbi:MAG: glycoside hydrolase [bacterium]
MRDRTHVPTVLLKGILLAVVGLAAPGEVTAGAEPVEIEISLADLGPQPRLVESGRNDVKDLTWWLPAGADEYVLPLCGGVRVDTARPELTRWLREGSPWNLSQLPVLGARYGERTLVVIAPWPLYAELIVKERLGIRYAFPKDRLGATPNHVVAALGGADSLEAARVFREWRRSAADTGAIPRSRTLLEKAEALPNVARLFGAPHVYLWGPALFSRHDVDPERWISFARALYAAAEPNVGARAVGLFTPSQKEALAKLARADHPAQYLTVEVSEGLLSALGNSRLLDLPPETAPAEVYSRNREAFLQAYGTYTRPPETWGDGPSLPMLEALDSAGISCALLVLSDLYGRAVRPDVAARAAGLGYLFGPYDSYHSVHSPGAAPDETWETAQFDEAAYEQGRVMNADGSGHAGFLKRGFQFSPVMAWPYVQRRVEGLLRQAAYSVWFMDCDATAECFDDYHPLHPATRMDDLAARRKRLRWLESAHELVIGSEEGSVLFADLVHFGHGVQTPYIGHLEPAFRDRQSPYFLGRVWPPDMPDSFFKAVPLPPSLKVPYFDPATRVPLYQAALHDEVIVTHHWSFDSFKFSDEATERELLEILYMVPPLYHLNRESFPLRRERIHQHLAFWGPLHRELAASPLIRFECLSGDRMVQRTVFPLNGGEVTITVNFGMHEQAGYPAGSATVAGPIEVPQRIYQPSEN